MPENPLNPKKLLKNIAANDSKRVDFDVDNWITDFELGFPRFTKTNLEFSDNYWGQGQASRPRIKELNEEADAQLNEGYRVIEFFPNRDNQYESYLLFGTPSELKVQVSLLMNTRLMLFNALAETTTDMKTEYLRLPPKSGTSIQLILTSRKSPPFRNNKGKSYYTQRQVSIPCVKEELLTYSRLREACGGEMGQSWGNWSARAYLRDTSGGIRQMVASGSSKSKSLAHLKGYLELTRCDVIKITTHEEQFGEGELKSLPNKTKYLKFDVYPSWVNVRNNKVVKLDERINRGKRTLSGRLLNARERLFLWMEKEPSWWQPALKKILKEKFFPGD